MKYLLFLFLSASITFARQDEPWENPWEPKLTETAPVNSKTYLMTFKVIAENLSAEETKDLISQAKLDVKMELLHSKHTWCNINDTQLQLNNIPDSEYDFYNRFNEGERTNHLLKMELTVASAPVAENLLSDSENDYIGLTYGETVDKIKEQNENLESEEDAMIFSKVVEIDGITLTFPAYIKALHKITMLHFKIREGRVIGVERMDLEPPK